MTEEKFFRYYRLLQNGYNMTNQILSLYDSDMEKLNVKQFCDGKLPCNRCPISDLCEKRFKLLALSRKFYIKFVKMERVVNLIELYGYNFKAAYRKVFGY